MVSLYVKDNTSGFVHEYGTDSHDALILQDDGSLHYENLQNGTGTKYPKEGYTFCLKDGEDPRESEDYKKHGAEPYVNIGGTKRASLDHIMLIEFIDGRTGSDMVALFDERKETEDSVKKYLKDMYPFEHKNIAVMPKEQFQNVFKVDDKLKAEFNQKIEDALS